MRVQSYIIGNMRSIQRKVLAAIPTNETEGQLRVAGVMRYASSLANWDLRIVNSRTQFNDTGVDMLLEEGIDGCILAAYTPAVEKILARRIPTIITLENMHEQIGPHPNCISILMDNQEIGRLAAEHFKSIGRFSSYAFVPAPPKIPWSLERKAAFFDAADKRAAQFEFPEADIELVNMTGEGGILTKISDLVEFLKMLPLPAGVFAANDILAAQVAKACRAAQLNIPSDIALVGCDNNELLCTISRPGITSIRPGFEQAGYAAARALDAMMRERPPAETVMRIPGAKVVVRGSTEHIPPALAVVNAAMEYIKGHALEGISTADVVSHLKISRSLLDLRFRQLRNESVMDAILSMRLTEVKRLLETTSRKLRDIGEVCGFRSQDYLKRLFKSRFGCTMREYRKRGE